MQAPLAIVVAEVLGHTPTYVWLILAALVILGGMQLRPRETSRARVLFLPVALVGYSLAAALSTFGAQWPVAAAWAAGMALMLWASRWMRWPQDVRYAPERERFVVPGSAAPLAAMLAVFAVRYLATVVLILNPALRGVVWVVMAGGLVYGLLSGVFALRARSILAAAPPVCKDGAGVQAIAPAAQ